MKTEKVYCQYCKSELTKTNDQLEHQSHIECRISVKEYNLINPYTKYVIEEESQWLNELEKELRSLDIKVLDSERLVKDVHFKIENRRVIEFHFDFRDKHIFNGQRVVELYFVLPEIIIRFSCLKKLVILVNGFLSLPKSIQNLQNLEQLIISFEKIDNLPDDIHKLANLKELSILSNKELAQEKINNIYKIATLEILHLKNLRKIGESIENLSHLNELELITVKFLPDSIGNLSKLKSLKLIGCRFMDYIPDSIGNLQSLEDLKLFSSNINHLPESIGKLHKLRHLEISYNQAMVILPNSIGNLNNLITLTLINNLMGLKFPESFENLNISDLIISRVSTLPDMVCKLKNLKRIYLKSNMKIPECISSEIKIIT